MKIEFLREKMALSAIACALALFASPIAFAQGGPLCPKQLTSDLVAKAPNLTAGASSGRLSAAAAVDPHEEAAYRAFFKVKADDLDKRIQLGDAFVRKYPNGPFSEAVYSQLTTAEYQKQDFNKMDECADKALALNPNDVTVLVFVGWVIPHSNDPSAQLNKAENYEKRVLELLPAIVKPADMTDEELATAKSQYESQAHSGLGLVYYQKEDFENALAEMKKATSGVSQPDPSDYFVMGDSLDRLDRYSDAAEAFKMCAAIPGDQQALCKQKAEAAKKEAASKPTPSESVKSSQLSSQRSPVSQ
ncbi:MAG: tetratricopeptide repeat protein [Candidatus Acidiferrales bacterium]